MHKIQLTVETPLSTGNLLGFSFAKDSVDVPVDLQSIRYMKRTDKYYQVELTYEQFRRICINGFIRLVQNT